MEKYLCIFEPITIYHFMNKPLKYAVFGAGSWATAIVKMLCENLNEVGWYMRSVYTKEHLLKEQHNPNYLSSVEFHLEQLKISNDINEIANYADVLQALESSAKVDSFVFVESLALPNIHWGHGKLDVYQLLESCLIYGCMDSVALNYNALATYQDSMACFYNITSLNTIENQAHLSCQPNPFSTQTRIHYVLPVHNEIKIALVEKNNYLAKYLELSMALEHGQWQQAKMIATFIHLTEEDYLEIYQQAIHWSDEMLACQ